MWIAVWTGNEAKCIAEHKRVSAGGGSSGILWAHHQPHSASPNHHSLRWRSLDEYLTVRGAMETSLGGTTECRWTICGFKVSVTGSSSGVGWEGWGYFVFRKIAVWGALEMSVGEATESHWMICGFRVSVTGSSSGVGWGGGGGGVFCIQKNQKQNCLLTFWNKVQKYG